MNVARKTAAVLLLALAAAAAFAQQSNATKLIAYQGSQDIWNQHWSTGTRTNIDPSELTSKEQPNVKTTTKYGACVRGGIGAAGASACLSEDGTVSVGASLLGGQASIYTNPKSGNMGGCVGVGVTVGAGVGASASAVVCGDKEKGLVAKTSVGSVVGEATTTYYDGRR
ncbi:hypothetical protein FJY68_05065 [candidate division WOR-3 bacterium]|uniref:Glycine zipper 2TM domain-containing protein n=1 Tax=candidate division WOR-3 bacterium TaxID=2052148 RepID=A0A937XGX0_UNCW3|nr:hypothetical protein [candidate division WOR-3 bacterium]